MRYLPIELDVRGRDALVAGASPEVLSKIDRLLAAGARVTVIAPDPAGAEIEARAASGAIALLRREVDDADLEGKAVVFLAPTTTPADEARARRLHERALRAGLLLSTIDRPETSTFVSSAVVSASGLTMTFSTAGASPGTARRIREDLEALFSDPRFARFLEALGALRAKLPRGERAARMAEAVKGFGVEARLRFPAWFERQAEP